MPRLWSSHNVDYEAAQAPETLPFHGSDRGARLRQSKILS